MDSRRRRHRRKKYGKRQRVFRVGDQVRLRTKNSYGELGPWEKGEIDKVYDGMYGEKTYQVYIESRDYWEKWVSARNLQHWHMSPEEARATNSLYELRKQLKSGERIKAGRPASEAEPYRGDRGGARGRSRGGRRGAPAGYDEYARGGRGGTRGGGGYPHSEPDPAPYHGAEGGRATSVPPQNYTWPQFIADLTHAVYTRDKDVDGGQDMGYPDEDGREKVDQTVNAPDEIRSAYGGGGREKKEADDYDDHYDDDDLNAREAVESVKGGDSRVADEYNLGHREDRGRRGDSYTVDRDGVQMTATKGRGQGQGGGGAGPLIYIHCHNEPASNRDHGHDRYESRGGRTRGAQ